jgi:hypothetical protein
MKMSEEKKGKVDVVKEPEAAVGPEVKGEGKPKERAPKVKVRPLPKTPSERKAVRSAKKKSADVGQNEAKPLPEVKESKGKDSEVKADPSVDRSKPLEEKPPASVEPPKKSESEKKSEEKKPEEKKEEEGKPGAEPKKESSAGAEEVQKSAPKLVMDVREPPASALRAAQGTMGDSVVDRKADLMTLAREVVKLLREIRDYQRENMGGPFLG